MADGKVSTYKGRKRATYKGRGGTSISKAAPKKAHRPVSAARARITNEGQQPKPRKRPEGLGRGSDGHPGSGPVPQRTSSAGSGSAPGRVSTPAADSTGTTSGGANVSTGGSSQLGGGGSVNAGTTPPAVPSSVGSRIGAWFKRNRSKPHRWESRAGRDR